MAIIGYTFTKDEVADALQCEALAALKCAEIYSDTHNQRAQRNLLLSEKVQEG